MIFRGMLERVKEDIRWVYDNGDYADSTSGRSFDEHAFMADVEAIETAREKGRAGWKPSWLALPDIVRGGMRSLEWSLSWLPRLPVQQKWLLVVQDGMEPEAVEAVISSERRIVGLFVGGSAPFKSTLPIWTRMAHDHGMIVHLGRASTVGRIVWANICGADSTDSTQFQWADPKFEKLIRLVDAGFVTPQMYFAFDDEKLGEAALGLDTP
jgi:hypothetical protein